MAQARDASGAQPAGDGRPAGAGKDQRPKAAYREDQRPRAAYREMLRTPWWLWAVAVAVAAGLAAEVYLGAPGPATWIPYGVLIGATVVGLIRLGRIRIAVRDGELHVDDAHIPVRFIDDVVPLDAEGRRALLGPLAQPYAFVIQRPWIRGTVQIVLDDPDDPTPYWVISTRHPGHLAAAVRAARAADRTAGQAPPDTAAG